MKRRTKITILILLAVLVVSGIAVPKLMYKYDSILLYNPENPRIPKAIHIRINRFTGEIQEHTASGWKKRTAPLPKKYPLITNQSQLISLLNAS